MEYKSPPPTPSHPTYNSRPLRTTHIATPSSAMSNPMFKRTFLAPLSSWRRHNQHVCRAVSLEWRLVECTCCTLIGGKGHGRRSTSFSFYRKSHMDARRSTVFGFRLSFGLNFGLRNGQMGYEQRLGFCLGSSSGCTSFRGRVCTFWLLERINCA